MREIPPKKAAERVIIADAIPSLSIRAREKHCPLARYILSMTIDIATTESRSTRFFSLLPEQLPLDFRFSLGQINPGPPGARFLSDDNFCFTPESCGQQFFFVWSLYRHLVAGS